MIYDEIGMGGVAVAGCGLTGLLHPRVTRFGIGDTLYYAAKARRGVLEKVVIKAVRSITNRRTGACGVNMYVDTFNALWNEYDLVTIGQAEVLVVAYHQRVQAEQSRLKPC